MSEQQATELREDYLRELDSALGELPHRVAGELREGIAEELSGLDADALARRIEVLGDPGAIAQAAAEAESFAEAKRSGDPRPRPSAVNTRAFAVASAIVLGIAGIAVPVVGWLIGAGMVVSSRLWKTSEKLWALLAPFALTALAWGVSVLLSQTVFPGHDLPSTAPDPLLPAVYGFSWTTVAVLAFRMVPASGLWLLLRLRGRTGPIARS